MKKTITKKISFDAAHKLENKNLTEKQNQKVYGKCYDSKESVAHGHTYFLEVTVEGKVNENGFIMNFSDLKKILDETIISKYDHKFLNTVLPDIITSCENQIDVMWKDIQRELHEFSILNNEDIRLKKLVLWETPTSYCTLESEEEGE